MPSYGYTSLNGFSMLRGSVPLAKASIEGLGRFDLTETPDPRTVKVWVDGVEWPSDWHIDGATIIFDVTPPEGAAVRVTYNNLACH